ncbi:MAG: metallopeptidase family protein [Candidatus Moraniibacteriota bacterium]
MISLSQEKFEQIVDDAVAEVPKKFLDKLSNVAIVVQDYPSTDQLSRLGIKTRPNEAPPRSGVATPRPYLLLGLYQGVPQIKRWGGGAIFPDKITIFKRPIEYLSNAEEDIKRIVKNTVKHEIAHHFGMSEEEVRRAKI